jgi:hypothetical protein
MKFVAPLLSNAIYRISSSFRVNRLNLQYNRTLQRDQCWLTSLDKKTKDKPFEGVTILEALSATGNGEVLEVH